jgi:predicted lactoylglutathione lyase
MAKQIFINLAVKDLQKSMDFYAALGFFKQSTIFGRNSKMYGVV